MDNATCRICFEEQTRNNPLIYPCRCTGTSKYIHKECLQHWRNTTHTTADEHREHCMECNYVYIIHSVPQKKTCGYIIAWAIVNRHLGLITILSTASTIIINSYVCPPTHFWDRQPSTNITQLQPPFIVISCYTITPLSILGLYTLLILYLYFYFKPTITCRYSLSLILIYVTSYATIGLLGSFGIIFISMFMNLFIYNEFTIELLDSYKPEEHIANYNTLEYNPPINNSPTVISPPVISPPVASPNVSVQDILLQDNAEAMPNHL